jgi:mRNA interferase HigB
LIKFCDRLTGHSDCTAVKSALAAWYQEARHAEWQSSADVKRAYASASIVTGARVVFNIKGNSYRLIVAVDYKRQIIFIKWIGTHANYDKINAATVEFSH